VDESSGEPVLDALGVFHGGQDWEAAAANTKGIQGRADDTFVCGKCVAGRPTATDHDNRSQRVCAGRPHIATKDQRPPVSVPRLPWNC